MNTTISHLGRFATTLALTAAAGVVWAVPTYADTSAAEAGSCTPTAGNASATVSTRSVQVGSTIKITGAGWCNPAGGGSVIGVKIDEGSISRLDTAVHANKTIWAIVEADSTDGTLDAEIELPDGTAATSAPALETGEHTLRLLSGSLAAGDEMRTVATNAFTVLPADEVVPDAPAWAHEEVRNGGATAWVQSAVTPGGRLKLAGTGWTHPQGGPSTIALKINLTENGEQARRTGSGILQGDATIWALLDASVVDADGNFDTDVDLPPGLTKGQYFTVSLFSGKFASGDTQRTATTSSLTVDGEKWQGGDDNSDVECKPTSDQPTVTIENPSATFGGMLTISGTGWCNPAGGGSKLGVKIDEGGISHLDSSVHANRTIWALVQARHSDGTFTAEIRLPDGTTKTSTPALKPGAHTLRLLSGSLLPGDQVRTLQSEEFVVGAYKPNGIPAPVGKLKKGKRNGLEVTQSGKDVTVKVKGAQKGDWVFLSAYTDDDSPRYPWGEKWFRADARGRIMVTLPKDGAITGKLKLVAQDGNLGRKGGCSAGTTSPSPAPRRTRATTPRSSRRTTPR
ncbi:hypothetical protein [Nocardioides alcanivorans]|uniref:hypothetical protein n=1 Tax=Nocardioides alcanivorans TaxID=2897352 RepID=UPI001F362E13|nr:hypothetical protein [Nocardioides alcanivorans]